MQTQFYHSNILTWVKTWKQHNQNKQKNHDRISAILHFLSCSKALIAISLALSEEAQNFLSLLVAFAALFLAIFAIWVAFAAIWVATLSLSFASCNSLHNKSSFYCTKWAASFLRIKVGLSIHWKNQPVHKLNWTYHIPNSLESTILSKNYTYLISAITYKPSPKIIHCQTCSQHTSLICTHMHTWTWVISTRRRHCLSTSCESNFLWIKVTIKSWNPQPI